MHMHCSITIFVSVVLYNAIVEDCILVDAYYHVHMLTVPIDECCYYCFTLMGSQFFYCSDGEWWYGISAVLSTNDTP